jgi:hypothetical protein
MPQPISAASLRQRIARIREDSRRLYKLDFIKRHWLAAYAADADVIADCLEELLNAGVESITLFASDTKGPAA